MTTPELTQDITGPFEVVSQEGLIGRKTWVLQQVSSGMSFVVTPNTTSSWSKRQKPPGGPNIILSMNGPSMVGLHLPTGVVFDDKAPPTGVK